MIKILHIQRDTVQAGAQNISFYILKHLPSTEFSKTIMFADTNDEDIKSNLIARYKEINTRIIFLKYLKRDINLRFDFLALKEIYGYSKREQYDIVHTHSTKPGILGRIAATIARVPYVVHTVHGVAWHQFMKFPKWQFYWLCEMFASFFCHQIILVNDYYARFFKMYKHKLVTIYNGIDYAKFFVIKEKKHSLASNKMNVLFVGRFDEQKNPLGLLETAKLVLAKNCNIVFTLVGDGDLYDECQSFINKHNLSDNIQLVGWVDNPGDFYARSDVFVSASVYEAFGLMFLEAGYFSLPVCTTNVEGIPEVIIDGVSGLLSAPYDYSAMADNILKLCNDKSLCEALGKENHRRATEVFSLDKMVSAYRDIYEKNIKSKEI